MTSLSFLTPWLALLGLAAPLLYFAYRRKRLNRGQTVPSILLLELLPKHPTLRRRFKPPLNFFFELLALLVLAAALAQPLLPESGKSVAILLDTSLSMEAAATRNPDAPTRFQEAQQRLSDWLARQSSSTVFSLYTSAPALERRLQTVSAGAVGASLRGLSPQASSDAIESALTDLTSVGVYDEVVIVSDRPLANDVAASSPTRLTELRVGEVVSNIYLQSVRLESGSLRDAQSFLIASVAVSGPSPQQVVASFRAEAKAGGTTELGTRTKLVRPGIIEDLRLPVPDDEQVRGYRVVLQAAGGGDHGGSSDAIQSDNEGWIAAEGGSRNRLLVIDAGTTAQKSFGLEQLRGMTVTTMSPEQYARLSPAELGGYSTLIFHGTAPLRTPQVSSVLILPPENNRLFPIADSVQQPVISSWASEHPITSYLRVPLLKPGAAVTFEVPPWA
ncbi:MAG: VWA domain-containing protein, partial [Bdellovibrionales bacterium]|nr:VWA domain-containing protein [Bdellovibrionales bacterium]